MPPLYTENEVQTLPGASPVGPTQTVNVQSLQSVANGITAFAGGGQASGTLLAAKVNRITVVATAGDSVTLPPSKAGMTLTVINADSTDSLNIFPAVGDAVNALSVNAAFALAANKTVIFNCAVAGIWNTLLTA